MFKNKEAALLSFCSAQFYFIRQGFLTSTYVNLETKSIELTVHFELSKPPILPDEYRYSQMKITSDTYYSDYDKQLTYVRCLTLTFNY